MLRIEPLAASRPYGLQSGLKAVGRTASFHSADVERAIKACEKAGLCVGTVRFSKDGFEIIAGDPDKQDNTNWFAGSPLYKDVA